MDGTKEFVSKNGEFTVNIALVENQRPVLGVIYVPVTDELYYAVKDEGSYYQGKKIRVSNKNIISEMILAKSRSHASGKLKNIEVQE